MICIKRVDGEAYLDRVKVKPGDLRHLYQQSDQQPDDPQG